MSLSGAERRAVDEIERRSDDLVQLDDDLVRFDTTAREAGVSARDEAAPPGARLAACERQAPRSDSGSRPEDVAGTRLTPPDVDFEGRPQLAARFGAGGGRASS